MARTEKPLLSEEHKKPCPALLKLERRVAGQKWVLRCKLPKDHADVHQTYSIMWNGDDR